MGHLVDTSGFIYRLIAMANVSRDFGWVRPCINVECGFMVKEGRHPLYALCNPTYVSNDILGDPEHTPVVLITGPNASGKTAFVRQVINRSLSTFVRKSNLAFFCLVKLSQNKRLGKH